VVSPNFLFVMTNTHKLNGIKRVLAVQLLTNSNILSP